MHLRISCGTYAGLTRTCNVRYGHARCLTNGKIPHGRHVWSCGVVCPLTLTARVTCRLFTISKATRACKLITLRAQCGKKKFLRRRAGPVRGCTNLFRNRPGTVPVRGPGVWYDWGIITHVVYEYRDSLKSKTKKPHRVDPTVTLASVM